MYYLLFYDVVDDYVARRAALRSEHLALAEAARDRGDLVLEGSHRPGFLQGVMAVVLKLLNLVRADHAND